MQIKVEPGTPIYCRRCDAEVPHREEYPDQLRGDCGHRQHVFTAMVTLSYDDSDRRGRESRVVKLLPPHRTAAELAAVAERISRFSEDEAVARNAEHSIRQLGGSKGGLKFLGRRPRG